MEQVLSNLIGNAIKYSPEGGAIEVTICADYETHEVLLSVRDQGIGIPLQEQAQVFGRFARADNAQAYGIRGTGLGLYLCRELVEQHGGRIWFESTEGLGSTFFVALPLTSQDASMNLVLDDGKLRIYDKFCRILNDLLPISTLSFRNESTDAKDKFCRDFQNARKVLP
jgi:hypothetical protein